MMNLNLLNLIAAARGFPDIKAYLEDQYITRRYSLDAIAADLEIGVKKLRKLLEEFDLHKPVVEIPITVREARRLGPDQIAKAHNVSRTTAWRWKREILSRESGASKS